MKQLKQEFNRHLERWKKYGRLKQEEQEKWLEEAVKLTYDLSNVINKLKKLGYETTINDIEHGIKEAS